MIFYLHKYTMENSILQYKQLINWNKLCRSCLNNNVNSKKLSHKIKVLVTQYCITSRLVSSSLKISAVWFVCFAYTVGNQFSIGMFWCLFRPIFYLYLCYIGTIIFFVSECSGAGLQYFLLLLSFFIETSGWLTILKEIPK